MLKMLGFCCMTNYQHQMITLIKASISMILPGVRRSLKILYEIINAYLKSPGLLGGVRRKVGEIKGRGGDQGWSVVNGD